MAIYKRVYSKEKALKEEHIVIRYLIEKYGDINLNKNMKYHKYKPFISSAFYNYNPRIDWVYLTQKEIERLYRPIIIGGYSKIARECGYNAERIRQVFIRRPKKLHPKIYLAIKAFQKKRSNRIKKQNLALSDQ